MSGGGSVPANTTQTTINPTQQAQTPFLANLWTQSAGTAASDPFSYYPGNTYNALNPTQTGALNLMQQRGAAGSPVVNAAQQFDTSLEGGNFLSAGNPYFGNMANQVLGRVVPGIESTFAGGNRMNSPGAAYATAQGATDALGGLAYQNYSDVLRQMGSQAFNAPQLAGADYTDINAILNAGTAAQQNQQNITNADIQRYYGNIQAPYQTLGTLSGLLGQPQVGSLSQTSPYFTNPTANTLGLLGGGLGLANAGLGFYNALPAAAGGLTAAQTAALAGTAAADVGGSGAGGAALAALF